MSGTLILGAGHAGVAVAAELRAAGLTGPLTLISDEAGLPYHRPQLSKDCLSGEMPEPGPLRPAAFYTDKEIGRVTADVVAIDRAAQNLLCANGRTLPYDRLILATGAGARCLAGAVTLRDLADKQALATRLAQAQRLVVIGGGMIGLEVAAVARARGLTVDVVEMTDRLMARSLAPELAEVALARHRADGIGFHLGSNVKAIAPDRATLVGGVELPADLVLAAIGSVPRCDLAAAAGLTCDDGIVTGPGGQTADPAIFALGDCARWSEAGNPRGTRHESVAATQWQAKCVAATATGGAVPAAAPLRLWSHQGALRVQMAGAHDTATRNMVTQIEGGLLLHAYAAGRLVAVQALDAPRAFGAAVAKIGAPEQDFMASAAAAASPTF